MFARGDAMTSYGLDQAGEDMKALRTHCGHGDPTAAVAFARIVERLTQGMSAREFASRPEVLAFVFTGLSALRDWVFNTTYSPSAPDASNAFGHFCCTLRSRLMECNGSDSCSHPEEVDGFDLWRLFNEEFVPVVRSISKSGDAETNLCFLHASQQ
jgi:hypothetical protein